MTRSVEIDRVSVYCGERLAGTLERTAKGSKFTYDPGFLESPDRPKRGIARNLPYEPPVHETVGVNLHTYFAGLLPEGLRLQTLIGRARTSPDDLFTLLIEAGPECIGDVYAYIEDGPRDRALLDIGSLKGADFSEAEESLRRDALDASIPGAQPKLSAATIALPLAGRRVGKAAILKLSPQSYPNLVENEHFFMKLARRCGLAVANCEIVRDRQGRTGLLVERFDRVFDRSNQAFRRIYQEDACQLCDRYPSDKCRLSIREICDGIASWCAAPKVAILRLLELYLFSYVIGNADLHAKNISVWRNPKTHLVELSPAYDLVSTLAYSGLERRMALQIDGKDDSFRLSDFVRFAQRFGIGETPVRALSDRIVSRVESNIAELGSAGLGLDAVESIRAEIELRVTRLRPG